MGLRPELLAASRRVEIAHAWRLPTSRTLSLIGDLSDAGCRWRLAGIRSGRPGSAEAAVWPGSRRRVASVDGDVYEPTSESLASTVVRDEVAHWHVVTGVARTVATYSGTLGYGHLHPWCDRHGTGAALDPAVWPGSV